MAEITIADYERIANKARQESFKILEANTNMAVDGMKIDSYTKAVNNIVNKPDKIVATQ